MKRGGAGPGSRTRRKRRPATTRNNRRSPKTAEIIALVAALSDGMGAPDDALLGRKLAQLLAEAYGDRGRAAPRWVEQLIRHYTAKGRGS